MFLLFKFRKNLLVPCFILVYFPSKGEKICILEVETILKWGLLLIWILLLFPGIACKCFHLNLASHYAIVR